MKSLTHDAQYICEKLEITEQQYCEMVEAGGYDWLNRYYSHVQDIIDLHKQSGMFWKWWVNQWEIRDNAYVVANRAVNHWSSENCKTIYKTFHEVTKLIIVPNSLVVDEINKMIRALEK